MDELRSRFLFQSTPSGRFHGLYPSRTHLPMTLWGRATGPAWVP